MVAHMLWTGWGFFFFPPNPFMLSSFLIVPYCYASFNKKKKIVWMIGAKINFFKKYFNTFKKNILKITLIMIQKHLCL
jgi:hypothetical protein